MGNWTLLQILMALLKLAAIGGFVSLFLWWRSGFWAPARIHRLAFYAGLLAVLFAAWLWSIDVPRKDRVIWLIGIFPALVYVYFGIYGRDEIKRHLTEKKQSTTPPGYQP